MMEREFWERALTPFDAELFIMVESLTGKPCKPRYSGGNAYFFEADYENHNEPQYILAMWDAIEGRTGERLLEIKDDADRHALFVRVKFSEQKYPGIIRASRDCSPRIRHCGQTRPRHFRMFVGSPKGRTRKGRTRKGH